MFEVLGFYKFINIRSIKKNKVLLQDFLIKKKIRGTIIIAHEGLNGTISGDNKGIKKDRNVGELVCLIRSEISEAMEGARKGLMDNHLKHKSMMEVELADAIIRIFDLAESKGFKLGETIYEKLEYNKVRVDHQITNRMKDGGKKF